MSQKDVNPSDIKSPQEISESVKTSIENHEKAILDMKAKLEGLSGKQRKRHKRRLHEKEKALEALKSQNDADAATGSGDNKSTKDGPSAGSTEAKATNGANMQETEQAEKEIEDITTTDEVETEIENTVQKIAILRSRIRNYALPATQRDGFLALLTHAKDRLDALHYHQSKLLVMAAEKDKVFTLEQQQNQATFKLGQFDQKADVDHDVVAVRTLGTSFPAFLFTEAAEAITEGVEVRVAFAVEEHLSHIKIILSAPKKPIERDENRKIIMDPNYNIRDLGKVYFNLPAEAILSFWSTLGNKQYRAGWTDNVKEKMKGRPEIMAMLEELDDKPEYNALVCEFAIEPSKAFGEKIFIESSVPDYAAAALGTLLNGNFILVIRGSLPIQQIAESMIAIMEKQQTYVDKRGIQQFKDPFRRYHTKDGPPSYNDHTKFVVKPPPTLEGVELVDYSIRYGFVSLKEYSTVYTCAIREAMDYTKVITADLESSAVTMILVRIPGVENETLLFGWVKVPEGNQLRLTDGDSGGLWFRHSQKKAETDTTKEPDKNADKVDTNIDDEFDDEFDDDGGLPRKHMWGFKVVSDSISVNPEGHVPVQLSKPWDKQLMQHFNEEVHITDLTSVPKENWTDVIEQGTPNVVILKMREDEAVSKQNLAAMEFLNSQPTSLPFVQWNHLGRTLLPCSSGMLDMPTYDVFSDVKHVFPDPVAGMHLNDLQQEAVTQRALGRVKVIRGPPGTGKSEIIKQVCALYMKADIPKVNMVITPANSNADTMAMELDGVALQIHKESGGKIAYRPVCRIYSKATEKDIRDSPISNWLGPAEDARPTDKFKSTEQQLNEMDAFYARIAMAVDKVRDNKFEGIFDKRVQNPELSLGWRSLERAGLNLSPTRESDWTGPFTNPDRNLHATFRMFFNMIIEGQDLSEEEHKAYTNAKLTLYEDTIRNLSVIIGTNTGCGRRDIVDPLKDHVAHIFADEAAHENEVNYLPFFAARLSQLMCLWLIGDDKQLGAQVDVPVSVGPKSQQMKVSLFARLIRCGFPFTMLQIQHRMVPGIMDIANRAIYNNQLRAAPSTAIQNRPVAQQFNAFMRSEYKVFTNSNTFWYNVNGDAAHTSTNMTKSRYNESYVFVISELLPKLLNMNTDIKIGLLAGYTAHCALVTGVIEEMRLKGVPGTERVIVNTFDGAQGEQFDIVVAAFCITDTEGFQADSRRLNVALTRAKDGFIVLCNSRVLHESKPQYTKLKDIQVSMRTENAYCNQNCHTLKANEYFAPKTPSSLIVVKGDTSAFEKAFDAIKYRADQDAARAEQRRIRAEKKAEEAAATEAMTGEEVTEEHLVPTEATGGWTGEGETSSVPVSSQIW